VALAKKKKERKKKKKTLANWLFAQTTHGRHIDVKV